jgi:hypothetical protein
MYQSVGLTRSLISSLLRLRQELSKLILKHTEKIADPAARSRTQGRLYEMLLNGLSVSCQDSDFTIHLTGQLHRTAHGQALTPRHRPKSLTGGRGKKSSGDGWPPRTVVEDKQRHVFPREPMMSIFPIAIINTVTVFGVTEATQTCGKITASYTVKQSASSERRLDVREWKSPQQSPSQVPPARAAEAKPVSYKRKRLH